MPAMLYLLVIIGFRHVLFELISVICLKFDFFLYLSLYNLNMEANQNAGSAEPPKKKGICCVCKPEKQARDDCLLLKSPEECAREIEIHKVCLRKEGFDV
jgi:cytochrome c oxidase assembly protein subunit 17